MKNEKTKFDEYYDILYIEGKRQRGVKITVEEEQLRTKFAEENPAEYDLVVDFVETFVPTITKEQLKLALATEHVKDVLQALYDFVETNRESATPVDDDYDAYYAALSVLEVFGIYDSNDGSFDLEYLKSD